MVVTTLPLSRRRAMTNSEEHVQRSDDTKYSMSPGKHSSVLLNPIQQEIGTSSERKNFVHTRKLHIEDCKYEARRLCRYNMDSNAFSYCLHLVSLDDRIHVCVCVCVRLIQASDSILLAAIGGPKWDSNPRELRPETGLLAMRSQLGLFANLRPAKVRVCCMWDIGPSPVVVLCFASGFVVFCMCACVFAFLLRSCTTQTIFRTATFALTTWPVSTARLPYGGALVGRGPKVAFCLRKFRRSLHSESRSYYTR